MKRKKYVIAAVLAAGIMCLGGLTTLAANNLKEISSTELKDAEYNGTIYTYALQKQYETSDPDTKITFEEKLDGLKLDTVQYETVDTILQTKTLEESKDYKDLLVKDESKIKDTITVDGKTYELQNVTWSEEPNIEKVSYTVDYGYCAKEPAPAATYEYTYTSPVFKTENTVTLPFVQLEKGDTSWVEGFTAKVTFHNLDGVYFNLGNHEFAYDANNLSLTESDYSELVKMLGYDTSLYRLNSIQWSGKPYKNGNERCRDATASGQQYAASYKAVYKDEVENGKIYTAHATYSCEVEVPAEEAAPTYVIQATGYYKKAGVWTNIITFVTEHKAVSAITFILLLFVILAVAAWLIKGRKKQTVYDKEKISEEE